MAIKEYNVLSNENQHVSVPFNYTRGNAIPLDNSTTWTSLSDAQNYANGTTTGYGIPYVGQLITVNDGTTVDAYVIENTTGTLKKLASGGSADEILAKLTQLSSELLSTPNGYIPALQAKDSALSTEIQNLSTNLSTDLKKEIEDRGANDTYLSNAITAEVEARDANDTYLSTEIKALSTNLSTDLKKEIEDRGANDTYLSNVITAEIQVRTSNDTYLSGQIGTLSTNLSTDLSAEINRATAAEAQALTDAKAYTNEVSTALSTDYTKKINDLSDKLSSAWHFAGVKDAIPTDNTGYTNGDVIIVNKKYTDVDGSEKTAAVEYAFDGSTWQQLGDESSTVSKYQLETSITDLSATVSAEIDHDVEALSTSLSTEVSAKLSAEKKSREDNDTYLSGQIGTLSTNLSTDLSAETKARQANDTYLSNAITAEVEARGTNDTYLSNAITAEVEARKGNDSYLSGQIEALSTSLNTDTTTEATARAAADTVISTAVDSKIKVQDGDDATEVSVDTVTIHKISEAKYAELLKAGDVVSSDIYIVSSDNVNAHGARVVNVADGTVSSDAATVNQLSTVSADLQKQIDEAVTDGVETLSVKLSTEIDTLSTKLSTEIGTLSTKLSTEIDTLRSNALSGVNVTGTGVLTALTETGNKVTGTAKSLAGTLETTGNINAITSITQDDYGQITAVGGVHVISSVAIGKLGGNTDYAERYQLSVDGTALTTTIDIPKDKVINGAEVVKDPTGQEAGTYIKISVDNVTNPLYVPVPTLVNTYSGLSSSTVTVTVGDGSEEAGYKISADVNDASITSAKIADSAVTNTKIADQSVTMAKLSGEFIFDCGNASGYTA